MTSSIWFLRISENAHHVPFIWSPQCLFLISPCLPMNIDENPMVIMANALFSWMIFLITWFFSHHITPKCHYIPWFSPEFAIPQSPFKKKKQRPGFSARGFSQSLQGPQGPQKVPNQANFMDEAANIWGITGILWDLRGLLLTTMTFNGLISRQSY